MLAVKLIVVKTVTNCFEIIHTRIYENALYKFTFDIDEMVQKLFCSTGNFINKNVTEATY